MRTAHSYYPQYNLKIGDTIYISRSCNGFEKSTIEYSVQEYKVHSIGKKRMYLVIGDDIMSKKSYSSDFDYGFSKTQEEAIELCSVLYKDVVESITNRMIETPANLQFNSYKLYLMDILENCKTAKFEIVINPQSK